MMLECKLSLCCEIIMLKKFVIMLNYAPVKNESYYAQNYASMMCQGLMLSPAMASHMIITWRLECIN